MSYCQRTVCSAWSMLVCSLLIQVIIQPYGSNARPAALCCSQRANVNLLLLPAVSGSTVKLIAYSDLHDLHYSGKNQIPVMYHQCVDCPGIEWAPYTDQDAAASPSRCAASKADHGSPQSRY